MASIITEPMFYAVALPAVIFLGLAKGGLTGLGSTATPLLAVYLPPLEASALLLPILLCQDAISLYVYRRTWDAWNLKVMLPGAAIGMGLGWLFASYVTDDAIRILVGVIALSFIANSLFRPAEHVSRPPTAPRGVAWGIVCGFASFASQGGGPPFQVFVLPQRLEKFVFVGTTTIFFAAVNAMKIVPYAALDTFSFTNFATSMVLLPLAVLANFVGVWAVRVLPTAMFYRIAHILLFFLGVMLLWQGLANLLRG